MKIIILYGNEPYLIDYHKRKQTEKLQNSDFNLKKFDAFTSETASFLLTFPIMDDMRIALLSLAELKELDNPAFKKFQSCKNESALLLVTCSHADERTTFYKNAVKQGWIVKCDKYKDMSTVMAILQKELQRLGATMDSAAMSLFLKKTNYAENAEVDLYFLVNELRKLAAYEHTITSENVDLLVKDNITDNIYSIVKLIQKKDFTNLRIQAELLSDDTIGTLSALLREFRVAYKACYYPLPDIGVKFLSLKSKDKKYLLDGIDIIINAIDGIKAGTIPEKNVLEYVFFKIVSLDSVLK